MSADWDDGPTWADPSELQESPPFSTLFAIAPGVLDAIAARMKTEGFRLSHPIEVWRQRNVILDGHTRRQAAIRAGLAEVPVMFLDFDDERAAIAYAVANQRDRRNLTAAEVAACILAVDRRKPRGGDRKSKESNSSVGEIDRTPTHVETAKVVGVSPKTVERVRAVADAKDEHPDIYQDLMEGRASIREAERRVAEKKRPPKPKPAPEPVEPEPVAEVEPPPEPTVADYDAMGEAAGKRVGEYLRRTLDELPEQARGECVFAMTMILSPLMRRYEITLGGAGNGS